MFNWIKKILANLMMVWVSLDESTKEKIFDTIVDLFESMFKEYYNKTKKDENRGNNNE